MTIPNLVAGEMRRKEARAARFDKFFQVPIFVAALLVIPVIVIEQVHVGHAIKTFGSALNWVIWGRFQFGDRLNRGLGDALAP